MAKNSTIPKRGPARPLRKRFAALLAALSVIMMSGGLVLVSAPAASAHTGTAYANCQDGVTVHADANYSAAVNHWYLKVGSDEYSGTFKGGEAFTKTVPVPQGGASTAWSGYVEETPTTYHFGDSGTVGPCGTAPQPTTATYKVNPATCDSEGSVEWTAFAHGQWSGITGTGPGQQSATPVADQGYQLTNPGVKTVTVPAKSGLDCRTAVTPVAPSVTPATCTGPGTSTGPTVVTPTTAGVTYAYNATTKTVTATTGSANKFAATLPQGFTRVSDTVATYVVTLPAAVDCTVSATPAFPSVTPPSCTEAGSLTVPNQPSNVSVTRTPATGTGPGDYTFTYAPAAGFAFPAGTPTTKTVTVLPKQTGAACAEVKGTGVSTNEPPATVKTPVVEGTSAHRAPATVAATTSTPVPSAVEAGLAGSTAMDSRSLLAQSLLGAGLMFLVAAGCVAGLVRRRDGAHDA